MINVKKDKKSNEELIAEAKKIKESNHWDYTFQHLDWSILEIDQIIDIGISANNSDAWHVIFRKIEWSDYTNEKLIEIGTKVKSRTLWIKMVNLRRFDKSQVQSIGDTSNSTCVWDAIIRTGQLNSEEMADIYQRFRHDEIAEAIEDTEDRLKIKG